VPPDEKRSALCAWPAYVPDAGDRQRIPRRWCLAGHIMSVDVEASPDDAIRSFLLFIVLIDKVN
jgi:hypothetical protein